MDISQEDLNIAIRRVLAQINGIDSLLHTVGFTSVSNQRSKYILHSTLAKRFHVFYYLI